MLLEFRVIGQGMSRADNNYIVANSKGILKTKFNFSSEWQGAKKEAVFQQGIKQAYNVDLNEDEVCVVPFQVIEINDFKVSVVGTFEDGRIITTNEVRVRVVQSGATDGIPESSWKENRELELDFSVRDTIVVEAEGNKVLNRVTVDRPEQLVSDNLVEGVEIAGIKGNYVGEKIIIDTKDLPHVRFWYLSEDFEWINVEKAVDPETHYCEPPFMEQHLNAKENLGPDLDFDEWSGEFTDVYADRDCIANYQTSDGYTHFYCKLSADDSVYVKLSGNEQVVDVDWGDGSTRNLKVVPSSYNTVNHVYTKIGTYHITIKNTDDIKNDVYSSSNYNYNKPLYVNDSWYQYQIKRVFLGNNFLTSSTYSGVFANASRLSILTLGKGTKIICPFFMPYNNVKILPLRKDVKLSSSYTFPLNNFKSIILNNVTLEKLYNMIYDYKLDSWKLGSGSYQTYLLNNYKTDENRIFFDSNIERIGIYNFVGGSRQTTYSLSLNSNMFLQFNKYLNLTIYSGTIKSYDFSWGNTTDRYYYDCQYPRMSLEICGDVEGNLPVKFAYGLKCKNIVLNQKIEENYSINGSDKYVPLAFIPVDEFIYPNVLNPIVYDWRSIVNLIIQDRATVAEFHGAYMLKHLTFYTSNLSTLKLVQTAAGNLQTIDLRYNEIVPTLAYDIYSASHPNLKVIVKDELYDEYITATNWVAIKDNIIKLSDYEKENE